MIQAWTGRYWDDLPGPDDMVLDHYDLEEGDWCLLSVRADGPIRTKVCPPVSRALGLEPKTLTRWAMTARWSDETVWAEPGGRWRVFPYGIED
jgi:hypothetical protein